MKDPPITMNHSLKIQRADECLTARGGFSFGGNKPQGIRHFSL